MLCWRVVFASAHMPRRGQVCTLEERTNAYGACACGLATRRRLRNHIRGLVKTAATAGMGIDVAAFKTACSLYECICQWWRRNWFRRQVPITGGATAGARQRGESVSRSKLRRGQLQCISDLPQAMHAMTAREVLGREEPGRVHAHGRPLCINCEAQH